MFRPALALFLGVLALGPGCGGGGGAGQPAGSAARYALGFTLLPPAGHLVSAPFAVEVTVLDAATGEPRAPDTPLRVSLVQASGRGTVLGTASQAIAGRSAFFPGLSYADVDAFTLRATASGSESALSPPLAFVLDLPATPGPFVALKTGRRGCAYADSVAFAVPGATGYGVLSGALPAGLSLDPASGAITGTPTAPGSHACVLFARTAAGQAVPIRCACAVFSETESEIVPGQRFVAPGPFPTMTMDLTVPAFTSSFDGKAYATRVRVHQPTPASRSGRLPVLVLHRGRAFHYLDYERLLARIASYGYLCATVEDTTSFLSPRAASPDPVYDDERVDAGMLSGSAFQEAVIDLLVQLDATPGHALAGRIDRDRIFVAGHSRGGGCAQASHVRGLDLQIAGAVYLMPYDLRVLPETVPPGTAPSYGIPAMQPRLPSLTLIAENDGDLSFPLADQLIERASGPMTSATIYGALHNYVSDDGVLDGTPYITRAQQQDAVVDQVVAFLKRWADMDLSVEGRLYGDEFAGSRDVGVTSWRNACPAILVDDFQDGNPTLNALGGANHFDGAVRVEQSAYPLLGNFASLGVRQSGMAFLAGTNTYATQLPGGTDASKARRLVFRIQQGTAQGFDWVGLAVRLRDRSGRSATVSVWSRQAQVATHLPDFVDGDPRIYGRWLDVHVALADLQRANPALDVSDVGEIAFVFDVSGDPVPGKIIYLDHLRFE